MADEYGSTQFTPQTSVGTANPDVLGPATKSFHEQLRIGALYEANERHKEQNATADRTLQANIIDKSLTHLSQISALKGPARSAAFKDYAAKMLTIGVQTDPAIGAYTEPDSGDLFAIIAAIAKDKNSHQDPDIQVKTLQAFERRGWDMVESFRALKKDIDAKNSEAEKTSQLFELNKSKNANAVTVAGIKSKESDYEARKRLYLESHGVESPDQLTPELLKDYTEKVLGGGGGGRFSQSNLEYRADRSAHQKVLDKLDRDPSLKKLFEQAVSYRNALRTIDSVDVVGPNQIEEFQQAIRSSLVKGPGSEKERAKTYITTLGMNWARVEQFFTGDPVTLGNDTQLMKHFKQIVDVERKSLATNYGARLKGISGGNDSVYRRHPDLKADLDSKVAGLTEMVGIINDAPGGNVSSKPAEAAAPAKKLLKPSDSVIQNLKLKYKGDISKVQSALQRNGFDASGVQ